MPLYRRGHLCLASSSGIGSPTNLHEPSAAKARVFEEETTSFPLASNFFAFLTLFLEDSAEAEAEAESEAESVLERALRLLAMVGDEEEGDRKERRENGCAEEKG